MTEYIIDRQYDVQRGTFSTVKREEIVRCRDCVSYRDHMWMTVPEFEPLGTDIDDVCTFFAGGVKVAPDGFCAWGERKADE